MAKTLNPTNVLLNDPSIINPVRRIGERRKDKTLAKTVRDLLRERIAYIDLQGDPHAPDEMSTVTDRAPVPAGAT